MIFDHDLLLHWMSERGAGTWAELRRAVRWLSSADDVRPSAIAHLFASLGHIEISWIENRWAAAPPVLTILPFAGSHALLTGGRTRTLERKLHEVTADDQDLFVFEHRQDAPTAILVAAEDDSVIEKLAARLGVHYDYCVADRLSRILPTVAGALKEARESPPVRGFGVRRLVRSKGGYFHWLEVDSDRFPGLYEYASYSRPEFRFVPEAGRHLIVDKYTGIYAELQRLQLNVLTLEMDGPTGDLVVPLYAPLPVLQARAAAFCSGLGPLSQAGSKRYPNVPLDVAERIAASLGQRLRVHEVKEGQRKAGPRGQVPHISFEESRSHRRRAGETRG